MAKETKEKCFIIMPISVPPHLLAQYGGDADHFRHVMDFLFVPAIEEAGLQPVVPIAKGDELIHAEIIKNLETCEMVLCDISTLNANVFFELGVRTALDKPACLVMDEFVAKIPFDTGGINHHKYSSSQLTWVVKQEIPRLVEHLKFVIEKPEKNNSLWQVMGLTQRAAPVKHKEGAAGEMERLELKLDLLTSLVRSRPTENLESDADAMRIYGIAVDSVAKFARKEGIPILSINREPGGKVLVIFGSGATSAQVSPILDEFERYNINAHFRFA